MTKPVLSYHQVSFSSVLKVVWSHLFWMDSQMKHFMVQTWCNFLHNIKFSKFLLRMLNSRHYLLIIRLSIHYKYKIRYIIYKLKSTVIKSTISYFDFLIFLDVFFTFILQTNRRHCISQTFKILYIIPI